MTSNSQFDGTKFGSTDALYQVCDGKTALSPEYNYQAPALQPAVIFVHTSNALQVCPAPWLTAEQSPRSENEQRCHGRACAHAHRQPEPGDTAKRVGHGQPCDLRHDGP